MTKIVILIVSVAVLIALLRNKFLPSRKEEEPKAIDTTDMQRDPVCHTYVDENTPNKLKYYNKVYYFCSDECMEKFKQQKMVENG